MPREPRTILPGSVKRVIRRKPYKPPTPPPSPAGKVRIGGKPSVDLDLLMAWVDSIGRPDDASGVTQLWTIINNRIRKLGVKPDKRAVKKLGVPVARPNINVRSVIDWINATDKSDLPALQKLFAAMRLRIRHANWLKRKR